MIDNKKQTNRRQQIRISKDKVVTEQNFQNMI